MRIGVFGGSFDPVHLGHLLLAEQCREQAQLDEVRFVLAQRPPHKRNAVLTPFDKRAEMLELAISGHHAFKLDPLERDREGPSYTVDTLIELRRQHPDAELFLMLGGDMLMDLPNWYQPARIVELASLLAVARADAVLPTCEELQRSLGLAQQSPLRCQRVAMPLLELASRDLRRRCAEGKSIRYQVPRAVEAYIAEKQLYRNA